MLENRSNIGAAYVQRRDLLGFDVNHAVLILKTAFD
jgi:hypothetical protein